MFSNYEEFRTHGKEMVDYICDYVKNLGQKPVAPVNIEPGFLAPQMPKEMPEYPESFNFVMDEFEKKIMPGVLHWSHPDFFGYFGAGNSYPSLLADMLTAGVSPVGFSWASCPALTELEGVMLDWYAKALDLPDFFLSKKSNPNSLGGGSFQASASDAIYICMCAARNRTIKKLKGDNHQIHDSTFLSRLICYVSSEAHSCVEKAAKMHMIKLRIIEPDANDSMRGDTLRRRIEQDIEIGYVPCFVVATLGTTGQCAFDNLLEIGQVCKKYPTIWLHVDGAYAGNSFVVPEMRKYKEGMEYVHSIEVNPNKCLMTTFDCTAMWVKNVQEFIDAFTIDPLYLQHENNNEVVDLRHFGIPLSRRFRALKIFFMFRMYGIRGLQAYIRRVIAMGRYFEKLVKGDSRFEILNDPALGLVCFRLIQPDQVNQEFLARMNGSGKIHLTPAKVKGKYIIRFVANQEDCNEAQIDHAWKIIQQFADETLRDMTSTVGRRLNMFDPTHTERFSLSVNISPQERQASKQKLVDEAGMLVFSDTRNFDQRL